MWKKYKLWRQYDPFFTGWTDTMIFATILWFLGLNIYLGRPLTDGMYLAILETLVCTPLFAMLWRGWLRKR